MSIINRSFPRFPQNIAGLSSGQFNQTVTASGSVVAALVDVTVQKIVNGFESILGTLTINGTQTINGNLTIAGELQSSTNIFSPLPAGVIIPYSGDPSTINFNDWLVCDGRNYSKKDYANLYSVIGTTYGSASPDTFSVPDFRGRLGVGVNGSANVVTQSPNTLGSIGGESSHILTLSEIPSHSHTGVTDFSGAHTHVGFNVTSTSDIDTGVHQHGAFSATVSGTHHHNIQYGTTPVVTMTNALPTEDVQTVTSINTDKGFATQTSTQLWSGSTTGTGPHQHTVTLTGTTDNDGTHQHPLLVGVSGNNNAHNNLQPYLVVNFFIKT